MKSIEEMSIDEIIATKDSNLVRLYHSELEKLEKDKIFKTFLRDYYGSPLMEIYEAISEMEISLQSELFFPGERIIMYPSIKEQHARQIITCDFSGGIIYPGSLYTSFRPLLKNIDDDTAYVLKRTIKVENGYTYDLPRDLRSFEALAFKVANNSESSDGIDYSHLFQRIGGEFTFQKLKRR